MEKPSTVSGQLVEEYDERREMSVKDEETDVVAAPVLQDGFYHHDLYGQSGKNQDAHPPAQVDPVPTREAAPTTDLDTTHPSVISEMTGIPTSKTQLSQTKPAQKQTSAPVTSGNAPTTFATSTIKHTAPTDTTHQAEATTSLSKASSQSAHSDTSAYAAHCVSRETGQEGLAPRACLSIWPICRAESKLSVYIDRDTPYAMSLASRPMSPSGRFYG
ncbi:hypothetical protein BDV25DRAFT_143623 [Aspergillus avenaceus]|uniref:Uncharacterized protein n=1 Tax=Aspergillus avenaceus TaxID=36643 RepID=A0A5N6TJH5_ASPAV|nr:hypothetical protein BDV25DRAFT_143623 [Aspergillus avenaceus]